MLTREQKIDFLKCCIAAYEDKRVQKIMGNGVHGFCNMFDKWDYFINSRTNNSFFFTIEEEFPEFCNELSNIPYCGPYNVYKFTIDKKGAIERAYFARQFIKKYYGIEVK